MDETDANDTPAAEVPVRMATKGLGWSGRETGDELEGELLREDHPDGAGGPLPAGKLPPATKKPSPPSMGPGAVRPEVERFGEAEIESAFDLAGSGKARPDNMIVAIDLAAGMGRARRAAR